MSFLRPVVLISPSSRAIKLRCYGGRSEKMTKDEKRRIIKAPRRIRTLPRWSILHSQRLKTQRVEQSLFRPISSAGEEGGQHAEEAAEKPVGIELGEDEKDVGFFHDVE